MTRLTTLGLLLTLATTHAHAQSNARAMVAAAVAVELHADRDDHTAYICRDHDVTPEHDTLHLIIETRQGSLKKKLEDHGQPLSPQEQSADDAQMRAFIADPSAQARANADDTHDDEQAEQMLQLLPVAFLWTLKSETPDSATLTFKPDPAFQPANMEARVLAAMAGEIVIAKAQQRIRSIRGMLVDDVKIAYGLVGRLKAGGTFQVERREVIPNHWQVTETHVHIEGHVFLFKSIGSQEDEQRWDFRVSHAQTLQQAYTLLTSSSL